VQVAGARGEPCEGWVVDRSRGGLCLSLPGPVAVGAVLDVQSTQYADAASWAPVEVLHLKPDGERWLVGCRFLRDLPWCDLLLFG
jgi:hypothetical protein